MIPKQKKDLGLRYNVVKPKTHEGWLYERENGIGASEVGAILGKDRFRSAYQLWRLKVGIDNRVEENAAMKFGHYLEPMVAEYFEEEIGIKVIKSSEGDWLAVDKQRPFLRVSPDRTFFLPNKPKNVKNKGLLEIKTSVMPYTPEDLADELFGYVCQVQYQLYVMGLEHAYIGMLNRSTGAHWFEYIPYNKEFVEGTLIPAIEDFWFNHVLPAREYHKNNPKCSVEELEQFAPTLVDADDVPIKYPNHVEGKTIELKDADELEKLQQYLLLKAQKKEIEDKMKEQENAWKLMLGDSEAIVDAYGKPYMTYKTNKSSMKFDEKKFASDCPDQYEQYCFEKAGARVLKVK